MSRSHWEIPEASQGNGKWFIPRIFFVTNSRILVVGVIIHRLVTWICQNFIWLLGVTGVMHEADDAYSIQSTWLCYWLDLFLTLAFNTWISSKFQIFHWICLLFISLILVGVEFPLCIVVTLFWNNITYFLESGWALNR